MVRCWPCLAPLLILSMLVAKSHAENSEHETSVPDTSPATSMAAVEKLAALSPASGTFVHETFPGNEDCPSTDVLTAVQVPSEFDAREQWPQCIHPIMDQKDCNACWAFGVTEVLSDRLCIASGGSTNVVLSPQDLLNCAGTYGCQGNWLKPAWEYLQATGVASASCISYVGANQSCSKVCDDGSPKKLYKPSGKTTMLCNATSASSVAKIQSTLMSHGPVQCVLATVNTPTSIRAGRHSLKIVGWTKAKSDAGSGGSWWKEGDTLWILADSFGTHMAGEAAGYFNFPATKAAVQGTSRQTSIIEEVMYPEPDSSEWPIHV